MRVRDIYITININGRREVKDMVQPVEAQGRKSICNLVDLADYDAACKRLEELGVPISYSKGNRPIVNIELFKEASKRWHKKHQKRKTPH